MPAERGKKKSVEQLYHITQHNVLFKLHALQNIHDTIFILTKTTNRTGKT